MISPARIKQAGKRASWAFALSLLSLMVCTFATAAEVEVRCLGIGNELTIGKFVSIADEGVELQADNRIVKVPTDALRRIELAARARPSGDFTLKIWVAAGDAYFVRTVVGVAGAAGTLDLTGDGWTADGLPLSAISGVATHEFLDTAFTADREQFHDAMAQRLSATQPDHDLISIKTKTGPTLLRARAKGISTEGIPAELEGLERTIRWEQVRWGALRPHLTSPEIASRFMLKLTDGSRISATKLDGRGDALSGQGRQGSFKVEIARVSEIAVFSERYAYLSKLKPESVEIVPFFDEKWPAEFDRCVTGAPLMLDGKQYDYGIGTGTRTELTYALAGRYNSFHCTVGMDQSAGDRGRVVFRALADGKEVFKSPVMTGASKPLDAAVPLNAAKTLTLISDFGSQVRADGNFADWADARLTVAPDK